MKVVGYVIFLLPCVSSLATVAPNVIPSLPPIIPTAPTTSNLTCAQQHIMFLTDLAAQVQLALEYLATAGANLENVIVNLATSDVALYLFNRSSSDEPIASFSLDDTCPLDSVFDSGIETVFIVHGWNNDNTSTLNALLRQAFLDTSDVNVFVVDWPAGNDYVYSVDSVPYVGQYLGEFIYDLIETYNYSQQKITLVGHSLGAHICGKTGKVLNGTLKAIVGLDPAGPLFFSDQPSSRLASTDARYVEVIHTDGSFLGINYDAGISDFWPNGGLTQPGCNPLTDLIQACSHGRSYRYFAESVKSGGFTSQTCATYNLYSTGVCFVNEDSYMGRYRLDTSATGDNYLNTNSSSPYSLN